MKKLIVFLFLCTSSCSTPQLNTKNIDSQPIAPDDFQPLIPKQLTFQGNNRSPQISLSGKKIIYVSSKRSKHKNSQVYIFDFNTNHERRITHQDGQNNYPLFMNPHTILYASSTDEDKEAPQLLRLRPPSLSSINIPFHKLQNFEIYQSLIDGSRIQRLTKNNGFDAFLSLNHLRQTLFFNRFVDSKLAIFSLNLVNKKTRQLTHNKVHNLFPHYSRSKNKIYWVQYNQQNLSSQILSADINLIKTIEILKLQNFIQNPQWLKNDRILFSSNFQDETNFELYIFDIRKKCLQRLTYSSWQELDPAFSPRLGRIFFSSNKSGSFQIYSSPINLPQACINLPNSITLK